MTYLCDSVVWSVLWLVLGYILGIFTMYAKGRL